MDKSTFLIIGREVCKSHPDIAANIIDCFPVVKCNDLWKIEVYFEIYCKAYDLQRSEITGAAFKGDLVEIKRVFVGAMYNIFTKVYKFSKIISQTLEQDPATTSRMISDIKFRYKTDSDFKDRVNEFLTKINYDN